MAKRYPWLGFLLGTQLCPVIWLLIIGLLAMFFSQAVYNPTYPPLSVPAAVFAYLSLACGIWGLWLLYRVTTADPGLIPRGGSLAERGKVGSPGSLLVPHGDRDSPFDRPLTRKDRGLR
jgi:hypothetical protein